MGNLRAVVPFLVLALPACDGGKSVPDAAIIVVPDAAPDAKMIDAPVAPLYDFSCLGNAAPTTSAAMVTISGIATALDVQLTTPSVMPLAGATVEACKGTCNGGNKLDTQTSAANGSFTTVPLATGGAPGLDGYLRVAKAGHRTSNVYSAGPINANLTNVPGLVFTTGAFQTLAMYLAAMPQADGNGNIGLFVTDCGLKPINGATVTIKQNGAVVANADIVDASALGSQGEGAFLVFNVAPGDTEVGATYMGMTLRAHTVAVVAGQTTATQMRPGF